MKRLLCCLLLLCLIPACTPKTVQKPAVSNTPTGDDVPSIANNETPAPTRQNLVMTYAAPDVLIPLPDSWKPVPKKTMLATPMKTLFDTPDVDYQATYTGSRADRLDMPMIITYSVNIPSYSDSQLEEIARISLRKNDFLRELGPDAVHVSKSYDPARKQLRFEADMAPGTRREARALMISQFTRNSIVFILGLRRLEDGATRMLFDDIAGNISIGDAISYDY